mmetsp:Transcript_35980/g.49954  ORF Transcript_35980/g.49954 Transcript_35980/m.49954 type:complete len:238 (-) Transcript_35980:95-808(-)
MFIVFFHFDWLDASWRHISLLVGLGLGAACAGHSFETSLSSIAPPHILPVAVCQAPNIVLTSPQAILDLDLDDVTPMIIQMNPRNPLVKWVRLALLMAVVFTPLGRGSQLFKLAQALLILCISRPPEATLSQWLRNYEDQYGSGLLRIVRRLAPPDMQCFDFQIFTIAFVKWAGDDLLLIGALADWWCVSSSISNIDSSSLAKSLQLLESDDNKNFRSLFNKLGKAIQDSLKRFGAW